MMYPRGSRNPCSHICTGELKFTVDRSICVTSGGTPRACWRSTKVPVTQSMPGNTCDRTCTCPHTRKIPRKGGKSPVPTSLLTVQSQMPNRNYVVATATLVTVIHCFNNSALSCFILNEIFDMLQQRETLFCD